MTLSEARSQALAHSPSLRQGAARVREARFQVDEAYTQAYPTLGIQSSANRVTPPVEVAFGPSPVTIQPEYNYSASISLRQAIFTFGRLRWAAAASELNEKAVAAELQDRKFRVVEDVTLAYYEALLSQESVVISQDQVAAREAHLEQARRLVRAGAAARFDVKRDEAALATSQQQLLEARNRAAVARVRLFNILDRADQGEALDQAEATLPAPPKEDLANLLQQRPDLAAARWAVQAAQARVELAEAQDRPSLGFQTDYVTRNATGLVPGNQWTVGLNFQIPLFDGGLSAARSGQAREIVEQLNAIYDQSLRSARLELESLRIELDNRYQRLEVSRRNLEASEEAARVARLRYANGLSSNVEQLDAEAALTAARQDVAAARYQYLQALARYQRAAGQEVGQS